MYAFGCNPVVETLVRCIDLDTESNRLFKLNYLKSQPTDQDSHDLIKQSVFSLLNVIVEPK